MKDNALAKPYFAAYPLKAIPSDAQTVNNATKPARVLSSLRFQPMQNPYGQKTTSINNIKLPKDVKPSDEKWFGSYE